MVSNSCHRQEMAAMGQEAPDTAEMANIMLDAMVAMAAGK
jgi:hypothetical protein